MEKKLPRKQIKVLYVCPFAHYSGHPPWAAIHEPEALARAGADVTLLTFYGIIDDTEVNVQHITVVSRTRRIQPLQKLINVLFTRWTLLRWPVMLMENIWTINKAMRIYKKNAFDIIHVRDGDPFLFVLFVLSILEKNINWVVSLIGGGLLGSSNSFKDTAKKDLSLLVYTTAVNIINSRFWRPLYLKSLSRNQFIFITQNEQIRAAFDSYMDGIFSGRVKYLPLGFGTNVEQVPKAEARRYLNWPEDKTIFLSFGVPHPGKDLDCVFRAIKSTGDVLLVQAGKVAYSVGYKPTALAELYQMGEKAIIVDDYIPEKEKTFYFLAADALILSYKKQFTATPSLLWEACLFGVPVIASKYGQLGELVEEYQLGLLFEPENADSLKDAFLQFQGLKPYDLEELKNNCKRFINAYSLANSAKKCMQIYTSSLKSQENYT